MKASRMSLGVGVCAFLAASFVLGSRMSLGQGNPFLGTWVLNVARSKYTPGPPPKDQTVVNEAAGQGIKTTAKGTDAAGKATVTAFTISTFDGKDYPVTGNPDYDMQAYKRVDANTLELTRKKAGKVVQTGSNVVSRDGKTRTVTLTGVDAQGRTINNVVVYDKK